MDALVTTIVVIVAFVFGWLAKGMTSKKVEVAPTKSIRDGGGVKIAKK